MSALSGVQGASTVTPRTMADTVSHAETSEEKERYVWLIIHEIIMPIELPLTKGTD